MTCRAVELVDQLAGPPRGSGIRKNSVRSISSEFLRILLRRRLLDDTDLLVAEAVELVDQLVDPPARRVDLTLQGRLLVGGFGRITAKCWVRLLTSPGIYAWDRDHGSYRFSVPFRGLVVIRFDVTPYPFRSGQAP